MTSLTIYLYLLSITATTIKPPKTSDHNTDESEQRNL